MDRFVNSYRSLICSCFLLLAGLAIAGCGITGPVAPAGGALGGDARMVEVGDLAGPGAQAVLEEQVSVEQSGRTLDMLIYRPVGVRSGAAIVFLPGLMASQDQYESYASALASRGFTVAIHEWYSPFTSDLELARDAEAMADWLVRAEGADQRRIGAAGHSMGAKDAVLAASWSDRFAGVVAIDPDDAGEYSVVKGPLAQLRAPLLLIGAEVAWRAPKICAPKETNYERFFERAPAGTLELTLRDADHVQMLDEPDRFGYGICRCGSADSQQVRIASRRATVGFFVQHLQGGPVFHDPPSRQASLRMALGAPVAGAPQSAIRPWALAENRSYP
jgi:dienelactone hydrolase